jgi:hypothetical protein
MQRVSAELELLVDEEEVAAFQPPTPAEFPEEPFEP